MIKCYWNKKEIEFRPFKYPAGEIGYKISAVPSKIICWFENSDDIVLLLQLNKHFPDANIILPYMPFGREDRRVSDNTSFGLEIMKLFQFSLFSGLETYDAHSSETENFVTVIIPIEEIKKTIKSVLPDFILLPDEGAKDRYENVYELGFAMPVIYGEKVKDLQTGNVIDYKIVGKIPQGRKILVIDDICDGGRTFIEAAKLMEGNDLYLHVSHGIFSKGFDELKKYYKRIYTTDSYKGERDNEFVTEYRCLQG